MVRRAVLLLVLGAALALHPAAIAQTSAPVLPPPPPSAYPQQAPADSVDLPMPIYGAIPLSYEDLMRNELAYDLRTPSNIVTTADYDPATGCYVVHTKLGDVEIGQPFIITRQQRAVQRARHEFRARTAGANFRPGWCIA